MIVELGLSNLNASWPAAHVGIGTFDGLHLGHLEVVRQLVLQARAAEQPSVLVTFDRHPLSVLRPESCPRNLLDLDSKLALIRREGVSATVILPFDRELAGLTAEAFLELLRSRLRAAALVVGHDFALGQNRVGTAEWLAERIPTTALAAVEMDGVRVSSSAIRTALDEGRVEDANQFLGRPYTLRGIVVPGRQLGRTLGFPTANLAVPLNAQVPMRGVYRARARVAEFEGAAVVNIGVRPTVGGDEETVEAHLLDCSSLIYGYPLELVFFSRIRSEQKFSGIAELRAQIQRDIESVRESNMAGQLCVE